jgi:uncharacterized membrane protein YgdD (TMEM256/DUF423 family)
MNPRFLILLAGITGALGVMLGAFGAHGLPDMLQDVPADELAKRIKNFDTGADYHLLHALAILGTAAIAGQRPSKLLTAAALFFLAGIAIFSGCLYGYSLTGIKTFGMIVPIGGVCFIVGWVSLAISASKE